MVTALPCFTDKKTEHRTYKQFAKGHTASEWWN